MTARDLAAGVQADWCATSWRSSATWRPSRVVIRSATRRPSGAREFPHQRRLTYRFRDVYDNLVRLAMKPRCCRPGHRILDATVAISNRLNWW